MGEIVTAAMVAIGDELLSGRTRDRNIGHLAAVLTAIGIDLREARIVGDDRAAIAEAVNTLRRRCDYVFTSGGIGPTHDDITADAIAGAFKVDCAYDADALALLERYYADRSIVFSKARRRMARMPVGARHIANPVSAAPGFVVENVFVMAGVPAIFRAMLENAVPALETGTKYRVRSIAAPVPEGEIGTALGTIQNAHPQTAIGSYPGFDGPTPATEIVIRGRAQEAVDAAAQDVEKMLRALKPQAILRT